VWRHPAGACGQHAPAIALGQRHPGLRRHLGQAGGGGAQGRRDPGAPRQLGMGERLAVLGAGAGTLGPHGGGAGGGVPRSAGGPDDLAARWRIMALATERCPAHGTPRGRLDRCKPFLETIVQASDLHRVATASRALFAQLREVAWERLQAKLMREAQPRKSMDIAPGCPETRVRYLHTRTVSPHTLFGEGAHVRAHLAVWWV